jgi:chromosome segregation ATPase
MKPTQNYKALYQQCTNESAEKDSLIVLLQQQLAQLVGERQTLTGIIAGQQEQLALAARQINEQQTVPEQQHRTIAGQDEKLSQQQTIIQQQDTLIATQQTELDKNKRELLRLDNLRYEMATIKKWIYGIKSEKRYQPTEQAKPQWALNLCWICKSTVGVFAK